MVATKLNPNNLVANPLFVSYNEARVAELNLLDEVRRSIFSAQLTAQDHQRDETYRGLSLAIRSAVHHIDANKHDSGKQLAMLLNNYGNIARKTLDAKTAAIDDLLREFQGSAAAVETLGLTEWVTQLGADNDKFKVLMQARYEESGNRPNITLRHARTATDKAFRALLDMLDVFMKLDKAPEYKPFVDNVNAIAERYKHIQNQLRIKNIVVK
jgi:hypothetical protein